jgi:hypothetical protein
MEVTPPRTTLSVVVPAILGSFIEVAVIVVVPTPRAVASPEVVILAIVVGSVLDQLTGVLPLLPSSYVPTALNCWVLPDVPVVIVGVGGEMAIAVSVG